MQADRLVALQGIVTLIEDLTGQCYCGGFWFNDSMPHSLLWRAPKQSSRSAEYRAPSWSWASVNGRVEFNSGPFHGTNLVRILGNVHLRGHPSHNSRNPREALRVVG